MDSTIYARHLLFMFLAIGATSLDQMVVAAEEPGVTVKENVVYKKLGEYLVKLDAYLPNGKGNFPGVVLIHGGAWRAGDKSGYRSWGLDYARRGVAAFSIDYRLSTVARYPAAVEDCLDAIRWLRKHASDFNLDSDRLGVEGGSAGGHLALMVALMEPEESAKDTWGNRLRNWVRCAISWAGPTDLTDTQSVQQSVERASLVLFLGCTGNECPDRYREASPVTYVSSDDPPILLIHGTADNVVPYRQAEIMQDALKRAGVPVQVITLEGLGHGLGGMAREERINLLEKSRRFMLEHLGVSQQGNAPTN